MSQILKLSFGVFPEYLFVHNVLCMFFITIFFYFTDSPRDGGMIKKTRDDAVFVTGFGSHTTFENIRDVFGSVGNLKVLYKKEKQVIHNRINFGVACSN